MIKPSTKKGSGLKNIRPKKVKNQIKNTKPTKVALKAKREIKSDPTKKSLGVKTKKLTTNSNAKKIKKIPAPKSDSNSEEEEVTEKQGVSKFKGVKNLYKKGVKTGKQVKKLNPKQKKESNDSKETKPEGKKFQGIVIPKTLIKNLTKSQYARLRRQLLKSDEAERKRILNKRLQLTVTQKSLQEISKTVETKQVNNDNAVNENRENKQKQSDKVKGPDKKKEENEIKFAVYVGNISYQVETKEVKKYFQQLKNLKSVKIIRKGAAVLVFEDEESCRDALKLNNHEFNGRRLMVKYPFVSKYQKNKKAMET